MKNAMLTLTTVLLALAYLQTGGHADNATSKEDKQMKIVFKMGDKKVGATLRDSDAARDFASLLPLTVELKDYANSEKISDLPRKLDIKGAPASSDPAIGDIAYYAPWGNLAIYYKDSPHAQGLVILGKVDTGLDVLTSGKAAAVTIERAR